MKDKQIILASASPRRKELLKKIIRRFKIIPSNIDEKSICAKSPKSIALKTSAAKARKVAEKNKKSIVIGADTIVVLRNKILGKPKNKKDAFLMLQSLSGTTHKVITGLAVIDSCSGRIITGSETTKVKMRKIKEKDIISYVNSGSPLDKAGGYGIQDIEDPFIEKIDGNYDNVVGLPVSKLKQLLDKINNE